MWRGQLQFTTPMLFCIGFLFAFLMGGVTGVMLAAPPIDFFTHDTYFVVAHFHQVLFGTAVFAGFAGLYYWYPKMLRPDAQRQAGQVALLADVHRVLGDLHAPVRWSACSACRDGWRATRPTSAGRSTTSISTIGAFIIAISFAILLWNLWISWRRPVLAGDNPWDAHTLEWFTTSPPPHHNYTHLPPIRSERPTWDYNHPEAPSIIGHGEGKRLKDKERAKEKAGVP